MGAELRQRVGGQQIPGTRIGGAGSHSPARPCVGLPVLSCDGLAVDQAGHDVCGGGGGGGRLPGGQRGPSHSQSGRSRLGSRGGRQLGTEMWATPQVQTGPLELRDYLSP